LSGTTEQFRIRLKDGAEYGPAGMELVLQWAREGRIPRDALLVPEDGAPPRPVMWEPELETLLQAPPTVAGEVPAPRYTASPSALVPTGNPAALVGYYFAVLSLVVPPLALVAFILGIFGLIRVHRHPASKGTVHAWIAILSLVIVPGCWVLIVLFMRSIS
jgi:hypothetical protein